MEMKKEPSRQQHDLNRHGGCCFPGDLAEQGQGDTGENIDPGGASLTQYEFPGLGHVGCIGWVS